MYRDRKTSRTLLCKYRAIPACHRDNSMLATGTVNRMAAPVTQTPSIAVPLGAINSTPTTMTTPLIIFNDK